MARTAKELTLAQLKKKPAGLHAVGGPVPGLALAVGRSGGRRWKLRRYVDGKQRTFDLGAWEELPTLEAARARAQALADSLAVNAEAAPRSRAVNAEAAAANPFLGPIALELIALAAS